MKTKSEIIGELLPDIQQHSTWTVLFHQAMAEKMGLKGTDHKCLDILLKFGPVTITRLAEITGLSNGAATGVVDRLEKKGFVKRTRSREDRRIVMVSAVEKKLASIIEHFKPVEQSSVELLSSFSVDELLVLQKFVKKFIAMVQQHAGMLRKE